LLLISTYYASHVWEIKSFQPVQNSSLAVAAHFLPASRIACFPVLRRQKRGCVGLRRANPTYGTTELCFYAISIFFFFVFHT
jgi:hypothetical protein